MSRSTEEITGCSKRNGQNKLKSARQGRAWARGEHHASSFADKNKNRFSFWADTWEDKNKPSRKIVVVLQEKSLAHSPKTARKDYYFP